MFEIQVALLGHVSVGKTTILNALLQDKYEVKKSRTTASVNRFHVSSPSSAAVVEGGSGESAASAVEPASSVLEHIISANKRLRLSKSVEEQSFHVVIEEPIVCEMRDDTQLVIIDIPGLNEQGSGKKYKTYVSHRWKTWDCVVLVMDATQGVNSEEQVELLEMVKNHFDTKKKIPIVILCNKFDDPEEDELIVDEVRKKVEAIFKVTSRSEALEEILLSGHDGSVGDDDLASRRSLYPAFIPIAAAKAFLYRAASRMTLEQFQQERCLQRFNIEELVRDEVGRAHKDHPEKRYQMAYEVISDPTQYQERLAMTNFDKFLTVLAKSVGGEKVQRELIHKQLLVDLEDVALEEFLSDKVQAIASKHKVLGNPSGHIRARFWVLFNAFLETAFKNYRQDMDLSGLSTAVDLLCNYMTLSDSLTPVRTEEAQDVFQALKRIVKFQCQVIEEKARVWSVNEAAFMNRWIKVGTTWTHHGTGQTFQVQGNKDKTPPTDSPFHWERTRKGWKNKYTKVDVEGPNNPARTKVTWQNLSPYDWHTIISSILLASYSPHFVEHFGREKVRLQFLNHHGSFATYFNSSYCVNCASEPEKKARNDLAIYTEGEQQSEKFIPAHPTGYKFVFQVQQPSTLSDPAHWGHVGWKFSNFAESFSDSKSNVQLDAHVDDVNVNFDLEAGPIDVALPTEEDGAGEQGDY